MKPRLDKGDNQTDFLKSALNVRCCDPAVALLRAVEARLISKHIPDGKSLDLGCGNGSFAEGIFDRGQLFGLDLKWAAATKTARRPEYDFAIRADASMLPFLSGSVRNVVSNSALEHMPKAPEVLREAGRVLKPGGRLLLTVHGADFGKWTVNSSILDRLGFSRSAESYRQWRYRRLALHNRWPLRKWKDLLEQAGLECTLAKTYFPIHVEKVFEKLLSLSYLGVPHVNLGSLARTITTLVDLTGARVHRQILAGFWAGRLRPYYNDGVKDGSCFLLEARKP